MIGRPTVLTIFLVKGVVPAGRKVVRDEKREKMERELKSNKRGWPKISSQSESSILWE
jgi:hypothetical protein